MRERGCSSQKDVVLDSATVMVGSAVMSDRGCSIRKDVELEYAVATGEDANRMILIACDLKMNN